MTAWTDLALRPSVVARSIRVALVVGTVLVAKSYLDVILAGEVTGVQIAEILLTRCVPYAVATYASVSALREAEAD